MTQLLISVKNLQEARLALAAGVDVIDLKDPSVGALGALDLVVTKEIVHLVNHQTQLSATVGEQHASIDALLADIKLRAETGVDFVKIAVSDLFYQAHFFDAISQLTAANIKIVAVFFADRAINSSLLPLLKSAGFYGAMLDTQNKQQNLLQVQHKNQLKLFTQQCHQHRLKSGLAGSLQPQHIDFLMEINPTYIGFRGGVCQNGQRTTTISQSKLHEVFNMLRNGNKKSIKAQSISCLALHS